MREYLTLEQKNKILNFFHDGYPFLIHILISLKKSYQNANVALFDLKSN